jgi:hypothetical protein
MIIISLFGDYISYKPEQICHHCEYSKREVEISTFKDQPKPYLHDKDTTLFIQPILENSESPGYRYIKDIKFYFKDLHYCSDINKISFISSDTSFSVISQRRISCKILTIVRLNDEQINILKTKPINKIIIENLVTDNIYTYDISDTKYFINVYKLTDSKY